MRRSNWARLKWRAARHGATFRSRRAGAGKSRSGGWLSDEFHAGTDRGAGRCLQVRSAIAAVGALRRAGVQADLLHAGFALCALLHAGR